MLWQAKWWDPSVPAWGAPPAIEMKIAFIPLELTSHIAHRQSLVWQARSYLDQLTLDIANGAPPCPERQ